MTAPATVYLDNVDVSDHVLWESLSVREALGSESSADFTLYGETTDWLADVRIEDSSGVIFRGQVIRRTYSISADRPVLFVDVQCAGYDRLLSGSPCNYDPNDYYAAAMEAWETFVRESLFPNDDPDSVRILDALRMVHLDPVKTVTVNPQEVVETNYVGPTLTYPDTYTDVTLPVGMVSRTDVRSVLDACASKMGSEVGFWVDPDLKFRAATYPNHLELWTQAEQYTYAAGSGLARMLPQPPPAVVTIPASLSDYDGLSDDPTDPLTIGYTDFTYTEDDGEILEKVIAIGDLVDDVSTVTNPAIATAGRYAPTQVISSPHEAYISAQAATAGMRGHTASRVSGSLRVLGFAGWRRGQVFNITNAGLGWNLLRFVIRGVTASPLGTSGDMQYTLEFGDGPIPSLILDEGAGRKKEGEPGADIVPYDQPVATRWELSTTNPLPDKGAGTGAGWYAQLTDSSGKPVKTVGVKAKWHLYLTTVEGIPPAEVSGKGTYLYLASYGEMESDIEGRVYNNLYTGADWDREKCRYYLEVTDA